MAIVQISKIQQRSGNLVDLPQLDEAELGWAVDDRRLFVGRGGAYDPENIEVLTSYSDISFSQIVGSDGGNFNISNAENGQLLTYVSSTDTWENYTGNSSQLDGGKIKLGDVANLKMDGGAIGYVLETDGLGNLAWTPKGALYTPVVDLTPDASNSFGIIANIVVMQVDSNTPYVNGSQITITGANGVSNTSINSQEFYVKLADDYPTSGNTTLYTDPALDAGNALVLGSLTYTNDPNNLAVATSIIATGGGTGAAAGSTTSIQYNSSGIFTGDAYFTWDFTNKVLGVTGIANISSNLNVGGNVEVTGKIISDVITGTAPLQVTSTTRVANLNVAYSNVSDFISVATASSGTYYPVLGNAITGNIAEYGNANLSFNAGTGNLSTTLLNVTSNANVGNLGTAGLITATGNITGGNLHATKVTASTLVSNVATGTAPLTVTSTTQVANLNAATAGLATYATTANAVAGANVSGAVAYATTANAVAGANVSGQVGNALVAGTVYTGAQPNITSVGTLSSVSVTANVTTGGIKTDNYYYANGVSISFAGTYSNSNVAAYLPTYTGNITANNITATDTVTAANFVGAGAGTPTLSSATNLDLSAVAAVRVIGGGSFRLPSLTSTQISALVPSNGDLVYNSTVNKIQGYEASAWSNISDLTTNILSTGSSATAGTITGNWSLSSGSKLQSTYADLAEYYEADKHYEPGTVLEFGGDKEVTIAEDGTTRIAGVVSTNPAYAMNAKCPGITVAIALQGRVPCKVRGKVRKGDIMVSAGDGYARPWNNAQIGMVIGKAIENFEGVQGVIEIAVGRL